VEGVCFAEKVEEENGDLVVEHHSIQRITRSAVVLGFGGRGVGVRHKFTD
jgi:hypothetical protein